MREICKNIKGNEKKCVWKFEKNGRKFNKFYGDPLFPILRSGNGLKKVGICEKI